MSHAVTTSLEFERRDEEKVPVLVVAGDVDAGTVGDFAAAVGSVIALEHPTCLVVDLSAVGFMDSTGLNELVRTHRALQRLGGRLVLRSPGETIRVLLDVTRVAGHLEID
jgi:anti-anti-sigma factor